MKADGEIATRSASALGIQKIGGWESMAPTPTKDLQGATQLIALDSSDYLGGTHLKYYIERRRF